MKPTTFSPELRRRLLIFGGTGLVIIAIAGIAAYFISSDDDVYIDTASISAPLIDLSPVADGTLNAVYVNEGDTLPANAPVALVGTEVLTTTTAGLIVQVNNTVGAQIPSG